MSRRIFLVKEAFVFLLFFLFAFLSFDLVQTGLMSEEKPLLLLHFDMNKTLIASDAAGGKSKQDVIIHCLADTLMERWSTDLKKPLSYSDYVKERLLPGSSRDRALKQKRDQKISEFLLFLKAERPDLYDTVFKQYEKASAALLAQKTLVFSSFYTLVAFLKKNGYDFSIIIRTFGKEIEQVSSEIEHVAQVSFTKKGHFQDGVLHVDGNGILSNSKDFYAFLKENRHVCIQDEYARWFENGERQEYGKPFPIDRSDENTLSLFFDDNISLDPHAGKNIVHSIDVETNQSIRVDSLLHSHLIFPVDTMQAIQDESYYVRLVQEALYEKKERALLSQPVEEQARSEEIVVPGV